MPRHETYRTGWWDNRLGMLVGLPPDALHKTDFTGGGSSDVTPGSLPTPTGTT
jgi:hypothetical protein